MRDGFPSDCGSKGKVELPFWRKEVRQRFQIEAGICSSMISRSSRARGLKRKKKRNKPVRLPKISRHRILKMQNTWCWWRGYHLFGHCLTRGFHTQSGWRGFQAQASSPPTSSGSDVKGKSDASVTGGDLSAEGRAPSTFSFCTGGEALCLGRILRSLLSLPLSSL